MLSTVVHLVWEASASASCTQLLNVPQSKILWSARVEGRRTLPAWRRLPRAGAPGCAGTPPKPPPAAGCRSQTPRSLGTPGRSRRRAPPARCTSLQGNRASQARQRQTTPAAPARLAARWPAGVGAEASAGTASARLPRSPPLPLWALLFAPVALLGGWMPGRQAGGAGLRGSARQRGTKTGASWAAAAPGRRPRARTCLWRGR